MAEKTVNLKGADELHIKDVGVFFLKDKKAYYKDGRPVEPDKLRVCQYCQTSPPFVATKEIDFAKHMVEQHPEHAKPKVEDMRPAGGFSGSGPGLSKLKKEIKKKTKKKAKKKDK